MKIKAVTERFIKWADKTPKKSFECELDFPGWNEVYESINEFCGNKEYLVLSKDTIKYLIYLIARDNESEYAFTMLFNNKEIREILIPEIIKSNEENAKWQLANYLGNEQCENKIKELEILFNDKNEYVSRMALIALGKLHYKDIMSCIESAWNTNHEYQRIAVLSILKDNQSEDLERYLEKAFLDGREYLVKYAKEISA